MPEQTLSDFAKRVVAAKEKLQPRHSYDYEVAGERPDLALYPEFDNQVTSGHFTDKYVKSPEYKKQMEALARGAGNDTSAAPAKEEGIEILPPDYSPRFDRSSGPLYQLWNAADKFGEEHKMSPEQAMNTEAEIMKAKNNAAMFAEPKVFWLENNVPGMSYIARAFRNMGKGKF